MLKELKVWKYKIPICDYFTFELPVGCTILKVDSQRDEPCMWVLVDPSAETAKRRFRFAGTGHPIKEPAYSLNHIDTFQVRGGRLVFHIFEVI